MWLGHPLQSPGSQFQLGLGSGLFLTLVVEGSKQLQVIPYPVIPIFRQLAKQLSVEVAFRPTGNTASFLKTGEMLTTVLTLTRAF